MDLTEKEREMILQGRKDEARIVSGARSWMRRPWACVLVCMLVFLLTARFKIASLENLGSTLLIGLSVFVLMVNAWRYRIQWISEWVIILPLCWSMYMADCTSRSAIVMIQTFSLAMIPYSVLLWVLSPWLLRYCRLEEMPIEA